MPAMIDYEENLRQAKQSLEQAERLNDAGAKADAVNDAVRYLLPLIAALSEATLPRTPEQ